MKMTCYAEAPTVFPCNTVIKINWKHINIILNGTEFETKSCYSKGVKEGNELIDAIPDKCEAYLIANIAEKFIIEMNANRNKQLSDFKSEVLILSLIALGMNVIGVHFDFLGFPAMVNVTYQTSRLSSTPAL